MPDMSFVTASNSVAAESAVASATETPVENKQEVAAETAPAETTGTKASASTVVETGEETRREPTREEIIARWEEIDTTATMGHSFGIFAQGMASIFVVLGLIAVFVGVLKKLDNRKKK